jgi:hypothetical protein
MTQPGTVLPFGATVTGGSIGDAGDAAAAEADAKNLIEERKRRREAMKLWGGQVITDVTLVIGMRDRNGNHQQVIHEIQADDDIRIIECAHAVTEEMSPVRIEGKVEGFEPTGKYRLKLDCKYVKI